ncbi:riboflavin synthase [Candidatus Peregrinibacteria bacterium]|nr:MAG: riboflavin synthase [Candidatus Peregrinibacteria bacterium]
MFTGLVQNLGKIVKCTPSDKNLEMLIHSSLPTKHFKKGASIAVDGVCLTVEYYNSAQKNFKVTAVEETLCKTTLGGFKVGQKVHLEAALTLQTPLGGQWMSGHVDAMGIVKKAGAHFELQIPEELLRFIAVKGSLVVNGVSLTVADVEADLVRMALIPETLKQTNLGLLKAGDNVNLEVDLIARYLDRLLTFRT